MVFFLRRILQNFWVRNLFVQILSLLQALELRDRGAVGGRLASTTLRRVVFRRAGLVLPLTLDIRVLNFIFGVFGTVPEESLFLKLWLLLFLSHVLVGVLGSLFVVQFLGLGSGCEEGTLGQRETVEGTIFRPEAFVKSLRV